MTEAKLTMHLSSAQARALKIIWDYREPIPPKWFAKRMWPDSPGHKRSHNCGYGSSRGSMMAMAGGGKWWNPHAQEYFEATNEELWTLIDENASPKVKALLTLEMDFTLKLTGVELEVDKGGWFGDAYYNDEAYLTCEEMEIIE